MHLNPKRDSSHSCNPVSAHQGKMTMVGISIQVSLELAVVIISDKCLLKHILVSQHANIH